jgi:hypothetical protein
MFIISKAVVGALIVVLTSMHLPVQGSKSQRMPKSFPTRTSELIRYNIFKGTRVGSRPFNSLSQAQREQILEKARNKAPAACEQMKTQYTELARKNLSMLPAGWEPQYFNQYRFEHVRYLGGVEVSPVYKGITKEVPYVVGGRTLFETSVVYYCIGRWIDMNQGRHNFQFNNRRYIVRLEAELEITNNGLIESIEDDAEEIPMGIRLIDGSVLVPVLAFQDLDSGQVYWTDDALESKVGAVVSDVTESIVIQASDT